MTQHFENQVKRWLPWSMYELIFNELSAYQRGKIDWYLLNQAIKASSQNKKETMHLYIAKFHREQIHKFGIKSIYHESR